MLSMLYPLPFDKSKRGGLTFITLNALEIVRARQIYEKYNKYNK